MLLTTSHARLTLQKDEIARLSRACDTRVDCVAGAAWITIDGDRRDIVLERGESFLVESDANVIVAAIGGDVAIELRSLVGRAPCATRMTAQGWMRSTPAAA
ncbi:MAG TPA: DUF2917 domain-containing protein [Albitalea sp.]|nr:DUF2917 domain-containing protein [Albitalea sp.]